MTIKNVCAKQIIYINNKICFFLVQIEIYTFYFYSEIISHINDFMAF